MSVFIILVIGYLPRLTACCLGLSYSVTYLKMQKMVRQGGAFGKASIGRRAFDGFQAVNRLRLYGGIGKGFTG